MAQGYAQALPHLEAWKAPPGLLRAPLHPTPPKVSFFFEVHSYHTRSGGAAWRRSWAQIAQCVNAKTYQQVTLALIIRA